MKDKVRIPRPWRRLRFWKHKLPEVLSKIDISACVPPVSLWFRALALPPEKVKVVILGQDPYPTLGFAHGLAFSVPANIKRLPPSLKNIFKELQDDLGLPRPRTGSLQAWAERGVLLLNTSFTTLPGKPAAHIRVGWDYLTYEVLRYLVNEREGIVFILWGNHAQKYKALVDVPQHHVICSGHPSPLAASAGTPFRGSKPFSRAAAYNPELGADFWRL